MVPWISLVIAVISAIFTWIQMKDRRRSERQVHISRVSIGIEEQRHDVHASSWSQSGDLIVVRNDGPAAVTVTLVALVYGQQYVLGAQWPVHWELDVVPPGQIPTGPLGPGESWTFPAPEEQSDKSMLGPVCQLTDANGRVWQRTTWGFRELEDENGRPWALLEPWFDRHMRASGEDEKHILRRIDRWMYRRSRNKVRRHPRSRRLPWQLHFLNVTWGYKLGRKDLSYLPWDAPRSWRYPHLWAVVS